MATGRVEQGIIKPGEEVEILGLSQVSNQICVEALFLSLMINCYTTFKIIPPFGITPSSMMPCFFQSSGILYLLLIGKV